MKNLLILGMLLTSSSVFASKFDSLKSLSNTKLEVARTQMVALEIVTHSDFKKVAMLKAKGATAQKQREATVAQAMHTLCPYFDDGVAVGVNTKDEQGTLAAITDFTESMQISSGDSDYDKLFTVVTTVNSESSIEVYSGSTSGNNTYGTVLGFYDTKTNELAVFANSNCGRDD
jgi:uncharacterized SAM-dependent methyltransferase